MVGQLGFGGFDAGAARLNSAELVSAQPSNQRQAVDSALEVLEKSPSLSVLESDQIFDLIDSCYTSPTDRARLFKMLFNRSSLFPQSASRENRVLSRGIKHLDKAISQIDSTADQLDLLAGLINSMGYMQAATRQKSTPLVFRGALSPFQDPQTHAYKLVKRFLSKQLALGDKTLPFVMELWSGGVINQLSNSPRTLSSAHWKRVYTSLLGNAALLALGQGVSLVTLEAVQQSIDTLNEIKLGFETSYPNVGSTDSGSPQPSPEELEHYEKTVSEMEKKTLQKERLSKSRMAISAGVQMVSGMLGLGADAAGKVITEIKSWGPIGSMRTLKAIAMLDKTKPLASVQEATARLTSFVLGAQLINAKRDQLTEVSEEVTAVWKEVLNQAFSVKSTLKPEVKMDLLAQAVKQLSPEKLGKLGHENPKDVLPQLLNSIENRGALIRSAKGVHERSKTAGVNLARYLIKPRGAFNPSRSFETAWRGDFLTDTERSNLEKLAKSPRRFGAFRAN